MNPIYIQSSILLSLYGLYLYTPELNTEIYLRALMFLPAENIFVERRK